MNMTTTYQHWQPGRGIRIGVVVCGALIAGATFRALTTGLPAMVVWSLITVLLGVAMLALWLFHGLGSEVSDVELRVWFGPGWIERRIDLGEVDRVSRVRHPWWVGWGIRWLGSGTILWRVAGREAVELELRSGRRFRIGTDDPEGLAAAVGRKTSSMNDPPQPPTVFDGG